MNLQAVLCLESLSKMITKLLNIFYTSYVIYHKKHYVNAFWFYIDVTLLLTFLSKNFVYSFPKVPSGNSRKAGTSMVKELILG